MFQLTIWFLSTQATAKHRLSPSGAVCFFFSLFHSSRPLSSSQLLWFPLLENSLPFITCKENFTWQGSGRAIKNAQLYCKHARRSLEQHGLYPLPHLLLSADTWSSVLKIGTFSTDLGLSWCPSHSLHILGGCGALTHTHTHTLARAHTPKFASAFNLHDISLTQKTHQLQTTELTKEFYSFFCPKGFDPTCVFLSSFFFLKSSNWKRWHFRIRTYSHFQQNENLQNLSLFTFAF